LSFVNINAGRPVRVCLATDSDLPGIQFSDIEIRTTFALD